MTITILNLHRIGFYFCFFFYSDDLSSRQRVKRLTGREHEEEIYRELGKDGYLFFYELDKTCQHSSLEQETTVVGRRASSSSSCISNKKEETTGILEQIDKVAKGKKEETNSSPTVPKLNPAPRTLPSRRRVSLVVPPELPPRSPVLSVHHDKSSSQNQPLEPIEGDISPTITVAPSSLTATTLPSPSNNTSRPSRRKSFRRSKDISCKTM